MLRINYRGNLCNQFVCHQASSHRCHAGLEPASHCAIVNFFKSPYLVCFIYNLSKVCFPLFALMQKVEQKDQGKPNRSACFAGPTHNNTQLFSSSFMCFLLSNIKRHKHNFFKRP